MQLHRLAQLPRSPAAIYGLPQAGFDWSACLAFDLGVVSFVDQFDRMCAETEMVAAPKERKKPHMVAKPVYTPEQLMGFLGINPEDGKAQEILAEVVDPAMWDAWVEDED